MPTDPNNERYEHDFADGEYGWGEGTATKDGYQDIIDQLEHDVPVVAPESKIEQYRPLPARRFVAEDSEREYIGDGTSWVQVASRGPNPTLQSATVNGPTSTEELMVSKTIDHDVTVPDGKEMWVPEGVDVNGTMTVNGSVSFVSTDVSRETNQGTAILSGDGSATTFAIDHGFDAKPSSVTVNAQSSAASVDRQVTWNDSVITIEYAVPPKSGNGNLQYGWSAEIGGR